MEGGCVLSSVPYYTDLIGKPFEYGGRGPDSFDCFGLVVELYRRTGVALPEFESTDNEEHQQVRFRQGVASYYEQVHIPQPMDIIMFQIVPRWVSHCGVYLGHGRFIHIMSKIKVAVETLQHPVWEHRQRGCYRFRGAACTL